MTTAISKIGEEILADAEHEAKRKMENAEKHAAEFINKARLEGEKEAKDLETKFLSEIRLMEEKKLSEARREAALKVLETKNEVINSSFKKAWEHLKGFSGKQEYQQSLRSKIENYVSLLGSNEVKIKLNKRDTKSQKALLQNLKLPPKLKLTVDSKPLNCIGGFVLCTLDETIKIDETFEAKFASAEKMLKRELSKILFSSET